MSSDLPVPTSARWTHSDIATADLAARLRRRLGAWLAVRRLGGIAAEVVLAAYEVMANGVEHAYNTASSPGPLTVTVVDDETTLTVTVADAGTWKPPAQTPHRGRGLELARAVADHVRIEPDENFGTVATLVWQLDTIDR